MNVFRTYVVRTDNRVHQGAHLNIVLDGSHGADSHSPANYITLSDGDIRFSVALSDEQARTLRETGRLELKEQDHE